MRILFTSLIAATVLILHILDRPETFQTLVGGISCSGRAILLDKEVRVTGLKVLSRTEVERMLPIGKSVMWWKFNAPLVQARVEENPWIGKAVVEECGSDGNGEGMLGHWGCFVVSITERVPRFVSSVDNESWLIAEDGTFLLPLNTILEQRRQGDVGKLAVDVRQLTKVDGLASRVNSPAMLGAQLSLAREVLSTLSTALPRRAEKVAFGNNGDVSVHFEGVPFPVVFGVGQDTAVPLSEQGIRCAKILEQFRDRLNQIERVDLAFDRVGVVKLRS